jgi:hypothetical protein
MQSLRVKLGAANRRSVAMLCAGVIAAACTQVALAQATAGQGDAMDPARVPGYAGIGLRDNPEGVVVATVRPGPLQGDGFTSPSLWRGDVIVSMNGQTLDAAGYGEVIRALDAGERLRIVYRRGAQADPFTAIPAGDPAGEERTVEIVLDDARRWRSPLGKGLDAGRSVPLAEAGEFEADILNRADALGIRRMPGGADDVMTHIAGVQQRLLSPGTPTPVIQALTRPLSLDRVEAGIAAQVRPLAQHAPLPQTLLALHAFLLPTLDLPDLQQAPDLEARLAAARRDYAQRAQDLMRAMRSESVVGPQLPAHLEVVRAAPMLAPLAVAMLPRVARHAESLEEFAREAVAAPQPVPPELADRVRAAVEGEVLAAKLVDGELWVVGGPGSNRYDMDRIAAVFDVGGDDTYVWHAPAQRNWQIVIDAAGDDVYESDTDFAGPASGVFSVAVIQDRSGNDRYLSHRQGAIAAGLFGVGVLIDEAGDDRYLNDTADAGWSQGAAVYGAGVLIDRAGDDVYDAQILSQGAAGPGAIGLLLDAAGNDTYLANGPHFPSAYGTPGVFLGMSQGFATGLRDIAPGGLGLLYDLSGNDFYSVGEFGQGTGYFQALGILHDAAGDDRYVGSRYAQGTGVHQAAGILVDDAGDDAYLCSGPAAQGAAWDQSVGMLVDRAGNDVYVAQQLAQGSAAQQAIGVLVDLGGADSYACSAACTGQGGDNRYHFDASQAFSLSVFLHRGGERSSYAQSRGSGLAFITGTVDRSDPAASDCCGLFSDE